MTEKETVQQSRTSSVIVYVILLFLILVILFLPPISLLDRLQTIGYQSIGAEGGSINADDGAQLTVLPSGAGRAAWVKLTAHPSEQGGSTDPLPDGLQLVSPVYQLQFRGDAYLEAPRIVPVGDGDWRRITALLHACNDVCDKLRDAVQRADPGLVQVRQAWELCAETDDFAVFL